MAILYHIKHFNVVCYIWTDFLTKKFFQYFIKDKKNFFKYFVLSFIVGILELFE